MNVKIVDITADPSIQSRVEIDQSAVVDYADLIREGTDFDPVVAFDDGKKFWLACGFHRFFAYKKAGALEIPCDLRKGSRRDAELYSIGSNAKNGLRMTLADRRKSVQMMLDDVEWSSWSDRQIARHTGASHTFVAYMRKPAQKAGETQAKTQVNAGKTQADVGKTQANAGETQAPVEPDTTEQDEFIAALQERNAELEKSLTLATLPEDMKAEAAQLIDDLREENRLLRIEIDAVKKSRDQFQAENAQLKKQVAMLNKKIKGQ